MIIGIDLGTTFSSCAFVDDDGLSVLCPDLRDISRFSTASIVHIGSKGCIIGDILESMLEDDPGLRLARFAKLSMGTEAAVYQDHKKIQYRAEQISALILKKIKSDAERIMQAPVTGAVITVPANFNEKQRAATVTAGRMAELDILGLIEEPVAAALYLCHEPNKSHTDNQERTLFVFDMGGGTLDATLIHQSPDGMRVLYTKGDNIGGKNFDEVILDLIVSQFQSRHNLDVHLNDEWMSRLRRFSTEVKFALTTREMISKPIVIDGKILKFTLHRNQFETAASTWIEAAKDVCMEVIEKYGLGWEGVDELLLTGGSCMMPCIMDLARDMSDLPFDKIRRKDPHFSVAHGAALFAVDQYSDQESVAPSIKQLVTGQEMGIKIYNPQSQKAEFHTLIERDIPVPVSVDQTLTTQSKQQNSIMLDILQRKDPFSEIARIGQFEFGPLGNIHDKHPILVTMGYDESGRVTVSAMDKLTGAKVERVFSQGEDGDIAIMFDQIKSYKIIS